MKKYFKLSPLAIYLTSGFFIILFVLNYITGVFYYSSSSNLPFDIDESFVKYTYDQDIPISYQNLFKPTQSNIKIIATTNHDKTIGLFDPSFYYYQNTSTDTIPSLQRYFSMDNYISGKKNAIYLADPSLYTPKEYIDLAKTFKVDEIINILDNSPLQYKGTRIVQNLFSLTCEKGNSLYLIGDSNELSPYISSLTNKGFIKQEISPIKTSLIDTMIQVINGENSFYILVGGCMVIILTIILLQGEITTNRSKIEYSMTCDDSKIKIFKDIFSTFFIQVACFGSLGLCFRFICELFSIEYFMTCIQLLILYFSFLLIVIIICAILFYINYKKIHTEVHHDK